MYEEHELSILQGVCICVDGRLKKSDYNSQSEEMCMKKHGYIDIKISYRGNQDF